MGEYSEDDLVNALIEKSRPGDVELIPEAHYNYYGDRGVVDLVEYDREYDFVELTEVKSESALNNEETGANSILRQFNRMRKYFFKDESWDPLYEKTDSARTLAHIRFNLEFVASEKTIQHLVNNQAMYRQAIQSDVFEQSEWAHQFDIGNTIQLRHPEEPAFAYVVFSDGDSIYNAEKVRERLEDAGVDTSLLKELDRK